MPLPESSMRIVPAPEEPAAYCDRCATVCWKKTLVIERTVPTLGETHHWHFECALSQNIITSNYLVRIARQYHGKT